MHRSSGTLLRILPLMVTSCVCILMSFGEQMISAPHCVLNLEEILCCQFTFCWNSTLLLQSVLCNAQSHHLTFLICISWYMSQAILWKVMKWRHSCAQRCTRWGTLQVAVHSLCAWCTYSLLHNVCEQFGVSQIKSLFCGNVSRDTLSLYTLHHMLLGSNWAYSCQDPTGDAFS